MSLQRLLGTMLASRMAGRGGLGGALGTATLLGGGRFGGKAGLAVLGYLAYRATRQGEGSGAQAAGGEVPQAEGSAARGATGPDLGRTLGNLIGGMAGGAGEAGQPSLAARIAAALNPAPDAEVAPPAPEETMSDAQALLLIRAMIAAAYSDGRLSEDERARICAKLDAAGIEAADRRLVERELDDPKPVELLLREVRDPETARQFYLASRAVVAGAGPVQRSYLDYLRQRLGLSDDDVAAAEEALAP